MATPKFSHQLLEAGQLQPNTSSPGTAKLTKRHLFGVKSSRDGHAQPPRRRPCRSCGRAEWRHEQHDGYEWYALQHGHCRSSVVVLCGTPFLRVLIVVVVVACDGGGSSSVD